MRGESHRAFAFAVTDDPIIESVPFDENLELEECCYILPVLVESGNPAVQDPLKNDKNSYFEFYPLSINAASIILSKCVDGVEVDQVTITDSTYGTFLDFGVEEIDPNLNYISLNNINWTAIFDEFGAGTYQFKVETLSIFASTVTVPRRDFVYDLQEFTTQKANHTVFMRIFNSGTLVDKRNNGKTKFTFPANWVDGKRFKAIFGNDKSSMEESYTALNDGFEEYTGKKILPRFFLEVDPMNESARDYVEIELRMANKVELTNYVNNAANTHVNTPAQAISDFDPTYFKQVSKAKFILEFKHAYESNYEKLHC